MTGFSVFMAVFVPAALILLGVAVLFLWARLREVYERLRLFNMRQRALGDAVKCALRRPVTDDGVVPMPSFDDAPGEEAGRDD